MDNLDQLNSLLAPILNDPEAMSGIAQAAAQLGLGGLTDVIPEPPAPAQTEKKQSGDILTTVSRLAPLLSSVGDDDTSRLLSALRPFLHGERAKRLDDAEQMLRLLRTVSTLREQGLL